MRVLLLDNIDSFVWNLAQGLGALGADVTVRRSNETKVAELRDTDLLVLSPGPGRPEEAGICIEAVRTLSGHVPIFGVCLGHQAIAAAFGATVERCSPVHGEATPIEIAAPDHPLVAHLTSPFTAGRYHSLAVPEQTLPVEFTVVARSATPLPAQPMAKQANEPRAASDRPTPTDPIVMAIAHRDHPTWAVQFHPESFLTQLGQRILQNVLESCR